MIRSTVSPVFLILLRTLIGGRFWLHYTVCAVVALVTIWGHRYPAGVDLPQHANAIQLLSHYFDPNSAYRFYYDLDFFTPYSAIYVLAWPFATIWGALAATKLMLSLSILLTPIALRRWLMSLDIASHFALLGFVFGFGFAYHWGFISFLFSAPISLFYLAAAARLHRERTLSRLIEASLLLLLLFFSHGATFSVVVAASGLTAVLQKNWKRVAFELIQFVPAAGVFIPWYLRHRAHATGGSSGAPGPERLVNLFSGLFSTFPNYLWMMTGLALVSFVFVFGRPRMSWSLIRILPLGIGLLGLFTVPETVGATWLVGTRFIQFVHLYSLAAFDFSPSERVQRWLSGGTCMVTLLLLGALNYRLSVFNRELDGLDRIKQHIPAGADIRLTVGSHQSKSFGKSALGQVVAWVPSEQGGMLENDQSQYWNNPVQRRRDIPWLTDFAFHISREDPGTIKASAGNLAIIDGNFVIRPLPRPNLHLSGLEFVRARGGKGQPVQNAVVLGEHTYPRAIEVASPSVLQLRRGVDARTFEGVFGVNQKERGKTISAEIFDVRRRSLWKSSPLAGESKTAAFSFHVDHLKGDLFLVVSGDFGAGKAYWLELAAKH